MRDTDWIKRLAHWLRGWAKTPRHARRALLIEKLKVSSKIETAAPGNGDGPTGDIDIRCAGRRPHNCLTLVGKELCQMGFVACTGISRCFFNKARRHADQGLVSWNASSPNRIPERANQMRDAIWIIVADLHEQSPYAKSVKIQSSPSELSSQSMQSPRLWHLPFHQKVCLWRLVKALHAKNPIFTHQPKYWEFRRIITSPEFKTVIFHRVVDIGRCPKCEFFKWKCASVMPALREVWQDALSTHFLLQVAQTKLYAADRAIAASTFPHSELYLACDCGSGHEFVLPHLSAADREGPSKAIDGFRTVPMKVM